MCPHDFVEQITQSEPIYVCKYCGKTDIEIMQEEDTDE